MVKRGRNYGSKLARINQTRLMFQFVWFRFFPCFSRAHSPQMFMQIFHIYCAINNHMLIVTLWEHKWAQKERFSAVSGARIHPCRAFLKQRTGKSLRMQSDVLIALTTQKTNHGLSLMVSPCARDNPIRTFRVL